MQLFVKTLQGSTITLSAEKSDTVEAVQQRIAQKENLPEGSDFRLIYSGKQLDGARSLGDYNIQENATMHLLTRLRGGAM
jgi:hypothetical protein